MDASAALEAEALRENNLEGFERNWVMHEDGEGAQGETGGGAGALFLCKYLGFTRGGKGVLTDAA